MSATGVIRDIRLSLEEESVLLHLVRDGFKPVPKIRNLVSELLAILPDVIAPSFVYAVRSANGQHAQGTLKALETDDARLLSPVGLRSATQLVFAVATIGPRLENKATEYFAGKEVMRAIVLDRIGNVAVNLLQQRAYHYLKSEIVPPGDEATNLLKPGGQCWPILAQRPIFHLLSPERIGVTLTSGSVMLPGKSTSMAFGIGAKLAIQMPDGLCASCKMGHGCTFRVGARLNLDTEAIKDSEY